MLRAYVIAGRVAVQGLQQEPMDGGDRFERPLSPDVVQLSANPNDQRRFQMACNVESPLSR